MKASSRVFSVSHKAGAKSGMQLLLVFILSVSLSIDHLRGNSKFQNNIITSIPSSPMQVAPQSHTEESLFRAFLQASAQPFQQNETNLTANSGGLQFSLKGPVLLAATSGFTWQLAIRDIGRSLGKRHFSIEQLNRPMNPSYANQRIEWRFNNWSLWYRNTPVGLEQGFTVQQPAGSEGKLLITFEVSAVQHARTDPSGQGVTFVLFNGEQIRYDHLNAWDALGNILPAHLEIARGKGHVCLLLLQVDDRKAVYPITIDPLIYLEQKLITPGETYGQFGYSVALDGDTALIGAPYEDFPGQTNRGAAYVFSFENGFWTLQQKLIASDGAAYDSFGYAVALYGDTALIGAPTADIGSNNDQGAAYFFTRSGSTWSQHTKVSYIFDAADIRFGSAVAIDGVTALIGAPNAKIGEQGGAAYVFNFSGGTWVFQVTLTQFQPYSHTGAAVDLMGDTALIGAPSCTKYAVGQVGCAFIYLRSGSLWNFQQRLDPLDGNFQDKFGNSVALAEDKALIGAPGHDVGANTDQGAAYVFTRSAGVWSQQQKLVAATGAAGDEFGKAVDLQQPFGYMALIGAPGYDVAGNNEQGAVFIFTQSFSNWSERERLTAPDGEANEWFGSAVALDDRALVGAPLDYLGSPNEGSAYIFRWGIRWPLQAKLFSSKGAASDWFGMAVDYSHDIAAVGAPYAEVQGADGENHGKVYMFRRTGQIWNHILTLQSPGPQANAYFGYAVALCYDHLLVGAPREDGSQSDQGAVYYFYRTSGTVWQWKQKITAADASAGDQFGSSLAVDYGSAWVGAPKDDIGSNTDQGSIYVYHLDPGGSGLWVQLHKFTASDGAGGDNFGNSVALSWGTALVGAPLDDVNKNADQGSAYVFKRNSGTWSQLQKLTASDGAAGDKFGSAVALSYSEDQALIGAPEDDFGAVSNQGSAYVFTFAGGSWTQTAKLNAADGATGDLFGSSVAICRMLAGDGFLVSAPKDNIETPTGVNAMQGSVYLFEQAATFVQTAHWTNPDGATGDNFGNKISCDKLALFGDNTLIISAYWDDIGDTVNMGSVYIFRPWLVNFLPMMLKNPDT